MSLYHPVAHVHVCPRQSHKDCHGEVTETCGPEVDPGISEEDRRLVDEYVLGSDYDPKKELLDRFFKKACIRLASDVEGGKISDHCSNCQWADRVEEYSAKGWTYA